MNKIDEEIEGWKDLLYRGIIDKETYLREVKKLKKKSIFYGDNLYKFIQKIIIILVLFYIFNSVFLVDLGKTYEYVENLENLPEPIQVDAFGGTEKEFFGKRVSIEFMKEYSVSGRVIDVEKYLGFSMYEKIAPRDVGMAWGVLGDEKNKDRVTWKSYGDRNLMGIYVDDGWLDKIGGGDNFGKYFSNNHLIPSDKKVLKLIKKIEEDDYVRIEGYLVRWNYKVKGGLVYAESSTSREDRGNHACETIYVTDVKWLKEK